MIVAAKRRRLAEVVSLADFRARRAAAAVPAPEPEPDDDWSAGGPPDEILNRGVALHEARDFEAAERHYRAALMVTAPTAPLYDVALFNVAVLLDDMGRTHEAIAAYGDVIARDPQNADSHFNLARLHERMGNKMAAVRHLSTHRRLAKKGR